MNGVTCPKCGQPEGQYHEGRGYARAEELGYGDRYRERYPPPHRYDDDDDDDRHRGYGYGRRHHKKRGGFLEDLFGD